MLLGFLQIGTSEMLFIVFIALLLFGGKKLPELARGLGKGIREFKDASESIKREISDQINSFERDLDVESAIIDDQEIERQRQLAKAEAEAKKTTSSSEEMEVSESDKTQVEPQELSDQTDQNVSPEGKEVVYKDPRMQAIFTPPTGTYQHQQGREPDYESQLTPREDDNKPQI